MPRLNPSRLVVLVLASFAVVLSGLVAPSAVAVGGATFTAQVDNAAGEPQSGTLFFFQLNSGNGGGNRFSGGTATWSQPAGTYNVRVDSSTMDGLSRWYVAGDPAGTTDRNQASAVTLVEGENYPEIIRVTFPMIAKVAGTVVDSAGHPVPGASVIRSLAGSQTAVVAGPDGRYDFGYVRSGTWTIYATAGGYAQATSTTNVPGSGPWEVPPITVYRAGQIHGTITDHDTGRPIPLLKVQVFTGDANHTYLTEATTGHDGSYRITGLSSGDVFVRFRDEYAGYPLTVRGGGDPGTFSGATPVTLLEGQDRLLDDSTLSLPVPPDLPAHRLSGTARDAAGNPVVGINVQVDGFSVDTDRWGRWYVQNVSDGSQEVTFGSGNGWYNIWSGSPVWFPVTLPAVTVTGDGEVHDGLDVTMVRSAWVRGTVVGATKVFWRAYDLNGAALGPVADNWSGANFTAIVPPGASRLLVWGTGSGNVRLLPRWAGDVPDQASARTFNLAPGAVVDAGSVNAPTTLAATAAPRILGTPQVGQRLTATTGTWNAVVNTSWTTTWFRGTAPVATGTSYTVRPGDVGVRISARVTAVNDGINGVATSSAVIGARAANRTSLQATSPRHRVVRLVVGVSASGVTPTGTVYIWRNGRVVKRGVRLVAGRAVVVLTRQASRRTAYRATYNGSTVLVPSASATVRVRVR